MHFGRLECFLLPGLGAPCEPVDCVSTSPPPEEKEEEEEEEPTEKGTFLLLFCCPCHFDIFFYLQLYFSTFRTSNMELTWRPSTSLPPFSIF